MPEQKNAVQTETGRIGRWLWHGGRLRVLKPITTNGGKVFEVGETIRLVRLEPYGDQSQLAKATYVSESDPAKGFVMTGWHQEDDCCFEAVTR